MRVYRPTPQAGPPPGPAPETPVTCPPSAVVDMIVEWEDAAVGDLVLQAGEFQVIARKADYDGEPVLWFEGGDSGMGTIPCGTYAAVRRYDVGEPPS